MTTTSLTHTRPTTPVRGSAAARPAQGTSEWLRPCPVCDGPMYVYAWRRDGWTDCAQEHRATTDPLDYERARGARLAS